MSYDADPTTCQVRPAEMDRVVLDAYGWSDIRPSGGFILDYEDDNGEEAGSRRKKICHHLLRSYGSIGHLRDFSCYTGYLRRVLRVQEELRRSCTRQAIAWAT